MLPETARPDNGHYLQRNGRTVGAVIDGELVKRVKGSVHMLRSPRGWAVDAEILDDARALGAVAVRIEDTETGKIYRADLVTIDAHGWTFDRKYGRQVVLPLTYWQLEGAPIQAALFA